MKTPRSSRFQSTSLARSSVLSMRMSWETMSRPDESQDKLVVSLQKAVRLVKHDFPFINPRWLLPMTFLSYVWKRFAA